ncbi:phosphonate metabolism protein/1,5-bisphosphokinase (PRPP-forming) PhnN [Falsiroseomonas bella]|uniref:ribose 1,5-bisphosphate phosphokinase n=2 Tax=Falsiroseomonas bella TaxID=2184016 RepID=A0A317FE62_9PROT|nr:phosphonate metabolism protein/1,5-bisphosphokinase (PRPP-forming) PhnN [Falsiroseomonas bella]
MAGARAQLAGDPRIRFACRVITRPAEAGGEDHVPATEEEFARLREAGGFALWWQAHGLSYGIPVHQAAGIGQGFVIVANLSRGVLQDAATRFPLMVLEITAPAAVLAARLAERGREAAEDVARRLAREAALPPGLTVHQVMNDGPREQGIAQVVAALRSAANAVATARR